MSIIRAHNIDEYAKRRIVFQLERPYLLILLLAFHLCPTIWSIYIVHMVKGFNETIQNLSEFRDPINPNRV
ncbi:hypothetical protein K2173_008402 [Erythroxylum novogranatense]|uniref:Uncharacterized protein n=1 Tax=Erythroxylum novogranatense TaxID=1862640 RepID=A0AAV8U8X2_9ROSI|nr:hypothetical protein K2173_008402 [Erythroxylum novogranatense]